ncbi:MAG: hypothetical protein LIP11_09660 [Clostridiales bacterium]|nr:hypothetical protein [Clostridiales bacterium]
MTLNNFNETTDSIEKIRANDGLPEKIHTEAHLWDEILKKEALEMPFLLLYLIREIHGIDYPPDVAIEPTGIEYTKENVETKELSSIRADIIMKINHSKTFHFECQRNIDPEMIYRMYEYDSQHSLSCRNLSAKKIAPELFFPNSAVLILEGGTTLPDYLTCKVHLPNHPMQQKNTSFCKKNNTKNPETTTLYTVAAVKVQQYGIQDIHAKQLYILIPYMPIRFSHLVRPDSIDEKSDRPPRTDDEFHNAKIELTNFYQDIILILDDAVKKNVLSESNQKDILALFRKAMIRVFHRDSKLLREVLDMTAPVLEWERETIARLEREKAEIVLEKNIALAEKDSALAEKDSALAEKDEFIRLIIAERDEKDAKLQQLLGRKKHTSRRRR